MQISKVELENFKSHENSVFEFGRGTTSITGENGAGKTSILEAIAWTIFDTLDYKKSDIVRRGAKKASVRVTLESGLDERSYTVYRDTGTGYYVYDPRLDARIADKKEEVTRFLWQHLGIEPGTDLESLFKQAIGVPQGTFTAVFLAAATERKKTFDTLLKVEEYRQSADELLKTVRFVDLQIAEVNVRIARAEGEIARIDPIESDIAELAERIVQSEKAAAETEAGLTAAKAKLDELDKLEEVVAVTRSNAERAAADLSKAELALNHQASQLERAREASKQLELFSPDAVLHQEAVKLLEELERERKERQTLLDQLSRTEAAIAAVLTEQKHIGRELERVAAAHAAIAALTPSADRFEQLSVKLNNARAALGKAEIALSEVRSLDQQMASLRAAYKKTQDDLQVLRDKATPAGLIESLEGRETKLVADLASAMAALERDQMFQKEIRNGLCPILSEKCLNLKDGQTLDGFLSNKFEDLQAFIDRLSNEKTVVASELKAAREARRFDAQAAVLAERLKEIEHEGRSLSEKRSLLENDAAESDALRAELSRLEADLSEMKDPKARLELAKEEAAREPELKERSSEAEKNLERLESERRLVTERLDAYKELDERLIEASASRDRTAGAYRTFLANEALASQEKELKAQFEDAKAERDRAAQASQAAADALAAVSADYDRTEHLAQRERFIDLQKKLAESLALLEADRSRHRELTVEHERLIEIRTSLQAEFRERERLKAIAETTEFIRTTLKEAAPLVARNYVYHVSVEANRLFREISGEPDRTLKWGDDYSISVEERGYDRPFQSLSGGEQMAAALAVRLALLKQLSDIRVAFFDEPTTNMDAERRENLAQQIGQITNFDQLFVISHDDTFEGYMDHEIRVGD